jgi:hypothetical protein
MHGGREYAIVKESILAVHQIMVTVRASYTYLAVHPTQRREVLIEPQNWAIRQNCVRMEGPAFLD